MSNSSLVSVPLLSPLPSPTRPPPPDAPVSITDLWSPCVSLMVGAVGAGILSFPFAARQQGVAGNVLFTIIFAAFSVSTDMILICCARWCADRYLTASTRALTLCLGAVPHSLARS